MSLVTEAAAYLLRQRSRYLTLLPVNSRSL